MKSTETTAQQAAKNVLNVTEAQWLAADLRINEQKNSQQYQQAQMDRLMRAEINFRNVTREFA